jgi:aromatic ring-opening dioxygenase LigB subunit
MPLIFGCIVPHGSVIPGTPGADACATTTAAMREIGRRLAAVHPDIVVVVTPHGIRVDGALAVSYTERAIGVLDDPIFEHGKQRPVRVDLEVDRELARSLRDSATAASVPTVAVHYGATSGPHDCYPLDWGAVVPLWFLGAQLTPRPRAVLVVPSRLLPLNTFTSFGRILADTAAASERRVALVASADLAHAHAADGPYGYDPAAAAFDAWIEAAVKDGDLARLREPDMELVRRAAPDGLWQILVLAGALEHTPMRGEFLSYERPTYYGMLTAAYAPTAA